jgi:chemotaxis protein methyltransferase CheR
MEGSHPELGRFATAIVARLGFHVHQHNEGEVDQVLRRCLVRTGCATVEEYVARFGDRTFARTELHEIALELTVPETYFFRHPEHFRALVEVALPERMKARAATRQLNVLSAGCATGEEAYSLAAAIAGVPDLQGWDVRLWGIDVNAQHVQAARRARYSQWSLRGVSNADRAQHFRSEGGRYVLDPRLASAVRFESRNLLDEDPEFWRPDFFDVVFCRNVMIYFSRAAARSLVERLTRSLAPRGFLFLAPAETLRGISRDFHLRHTHGAFYYQRRLPDEPVDATPVSPAAQPSTIAVPAAPGHRRNPAWASAIADASTRIAALADRTTSSPPPLGASCREAQNLDAVRELLAQERYEDALKVIASLPREAAARPDVLLLQAVVLANTGELSAAEEVCRELLARDELGPGAHYLLAFCDERRGDYLSAAEHDQTAIHLDAAFAMPHLHLGVLATRLGDLPTARKELGEALALLAGEDTSRILLFGGGFTRGSLIRFCQAQLDRGGAGR